MIKKDSRSSIKKIILFILAVLFTAQLQNSQELLNTHNFVGIYLLIPLTISIAMFEHEFSAFFFGLLAGAVWDLSSTITDGVLTLFLAVSACVCGLLTHYILRNTLFSAQLLTAITTAIYILISILFNIIPNGSNGLNHLILYFYIPSFILTLLLLPVSYYFVKAAEKHYKSTEQTRN